MFNIHCIDIAHQVRSVYAMGINMLGKYNKLRNVDVFAQREPFIGRHITR